MKRIALLKDGIVQNVVAQPDNYEAGEDEVDISASPVGPGWTYDGENFGAPTVMVPAVLDSADWKEYAYGVLGAIAAPAGTDDEKLAAGLARYGRIIKDARASESDAVYGALDQYDDATNFHKEKVAIFLGVLVTDEVVTPTEFAAIIANWPNLQVNR